MSSLGSKDLFSVQKTFEGSESQMLDYLLFHRNSPVLPLSSCYWLNLWIYTHLQTIMYILTYLNFNAVNIIIFILDIFSDLSQVAQS